MSQALTLDVTRQGLPETVAYRYELGGGKQLIIRCLYRLDATTQIGKGHIIDSQATTVPRAALSRKRRFRKHRSCDYVLSEMEGVIELIVYKK
jgi:hypothetical protein